MHETAIAKNIISEAEKHGEVESIKLDIGELAHVPGNELVECLKKLVDWTIEWKETPARVECECGFRGHPSILERGHDSFLIECPQCRSLPALTGGNEIKIVEVMVKE